MNKKVKNGLYFGFSACDYCLYIGFLWVWKWFLSKRPLVWSDQMTLLWRFSGPSPNTRTASMFCLHQILNQEPSRTLFSPVLKMPSFHRPNSCSLPLNKLNKLPPPFFTVAIALWILSMARIPIRLLDLTLSPAASVSPYTILTPPSPTRPPPALLPPPFSSKAEICRYSSNGKLSLRPRQVFPTDRIHSDIMVFLLWNFKPGSTEWPLGSQALSRTTYNAIKYQCVSQTYASGLRLVLKMYLFMYPEYHLLALCQQNWGLIEAICPQRRQENFHNMNFMFKTSNKHPVPKGSLRMHL